MKKLIPFLITCIAMCLMIVPMRVSAEGTHIDEIRLNVTEPVAGKYSESCRRDQLGNQEIFKCFTLNDKYEMWFSDALNDTNKLSPVYWWKEYSTTYDNYAGNFGNDDKYEAGASYRFSIQLTAKSGYYFDENTKVYVNGILQSEGLKYHSGWGYWYFNKMYKVAGDTYTVKYDANGAAGVMADGSIDQNNYLTLPDCTYTAPTDKVFDSWEISGTSYNPGDKVKITDSMVSSGVLTVKAVWVQNGNYTVTFNMNGHGTQVAPQTGIERNGKVTKPITPDISDGYKFYAWYKDSDCTEEYDFNSQVQGNITLYAKWNKIIETITVTGLNQPVGGDNASGNCEISSLQIPAGANYSIKELRWLVGEPGDNYENSFSSTYENGKSYIAVVYIEPNEGYCLDATYTNATINDRTASVVSTNIKVAFKADGGDNTYSVSFDSNGGTGSMASKEIYENSRMDLPQCTFTAPVGKEFKKWEVNGVEKRPGDSVIVTENMTVKAIWSTKACYVYYNWNGIKPDSEKNSQVWLYGNSVGSLPSNLTYEGYVLEGWYNDPYFNEKTTLPFTITEDITIYAKWTAQIEYTVSFDMNGHGTQVPDQKVAQNTTAADPGTPTESGYTFKGWFADSACLVPFDFSSGIIADTTVFAKWESGDPSPAPDPEGPKPGTQTNASAIMNRNLSNMIKNASKQQGYTVIYFNDFTGNDSICKDVLELLAQNPNVVLVLDYTFFDENTNQDIHVHIVINQAILSWVMREDIDYYGPACLSGFVQYYNLLPAEIRSRNY